MPGLGSNPGGHFGGQFPEEKHGNVGVWGWNGGNLSETPHQWMGLIGDDKLHHGAGLGATPEEAVRAAMGFVELRYWRRCPLRLDGVATEGRGAASLGRAGVVSVGGRPAAALTREALIR